MSGENKSRKDSLGLPEGLPVTLEDAFGIARFALSLPRRTVTGAVELGKETAEKGVSISTILGKKAVGMLPFISDDEPKLGDR